jgi:hypothetical protein
VVFDWEHADPVLAWTIFPYWSINAFYGAVAVRLSHRRTSSTAMAGGC